MSATFKITCDAGYDFAHVPTAFGSSIGRVHVTSITWDDKSRTPYAVKGLGRPRNASHLSAKPVLLSKRAADAVAKQATERWGFRNVTIEEVN